MNRHNNNFVVNLTYEKTVCEYVAPLLENKGQGGRFKKIIKILKFNEKKVL